MLPVLKLVAVHIEGTSAYFAQQHITVSGLEFTGFKAHRLGTIAASAALVKHQRPVLLLKAFYQFKGFIGSNNAVCLHKSCFNRTKGEQLAIKPLFPLQTPCAYHGFLISMLKETKLVFTIGYQHILSLTIVIQHHLMRLPAKA